MKLTIAFITSRYEPGFDWFLESLAKQLLPEDDIQIVIVDFFAQACDEWAPCIVAQRPDPLFKLLQDSKIPSNATLEWHPPMPSVWQGPNRLPKDNWWAMAAARNTALCYAKGDWFLHLDDRCVLQPGFMAAVRENMKKQQLVFGAYQKRTGMTVENGVIKNEGVVSRNDERRPHINQFAKGEWVIPCTGDWYYGCVGLGPLDWYLNVNGWDTTCDGLSYEDIVLGHHLANNGYPMAYDYRMMIVEDRTPGQCDPQFKRADKGVFPNNKSHALMDMLKPLKRAKHNLDLREIRKNVLAGQPFPPATGPIVDWWDGQLIKDF